MYNVLTCDMEFPNIDMQSVLLCLPHGKFHFDMRCDHIQRKYTIPLLVQVIQYVPVITITKTCALSNGDYDIQEADFSEYITI